MTLVGSNLLASEAVLLVRIGLGRYALPLASVERVLQMAYVPPLPEASDGLLGMLNLHGQVLPVVDPHPRLGLASPTVAVEHRLVQLKADAPFLLWVDDVEDVVALSTAEVGAVPATDANPLVGRAVRVGDDVLHCLAPTALEPHAWLR